MKNMKGEDLDALPIAPGTITATPRRALGGQVMSWSLRVFGCTCNEAGEHHATVEAEACAARVIERYQLELARAAELRRIEGVVAVVRDIREGAR